jgi:hypothetical protein
MANTERLTIQPKSIDASNNETLQSQYLAEASYSNSYTFDEIILAANTAFIFIDGNYLDATYGASHLMVEILSDQPISVTIMDYSLSTIQALTDVKNLIMNYSVAKTYRYKVKNLSGYNAHVIVRWYA